MSSGKRARRRHAPSTGVGEAMEAIHERHQELMRVYQDATQHEHADATDVRPEDLDALRRNFQFIRDDEEDIKRGSEDWQVRMSVRYYRQLFREYALADLSRYEEGKIGLRWRTEQEVVSGKGQFSCGNKRCDERRRLHSYELLFAYVEQGEKKRCLVKVRACEACARKLFYKKLKAAAEKKSRKEKQKKKALASGKNKRRRREAPSSSETDSDSSRDSNNGDDDVSVHAMCGSINRAETRAFRETTQAKREGSTTDDAMDRDLRRLFV
ncbi:hypothetical protein Poli38472_010483 [Pythium oligandrum]|uniref:Protein FRA10AC1 n=1 Tax=Pythium oligandrum TaxID=41045 RepID=A0A8K1C360_PYTOL|nr:hypothetical protein Poli38472_010483 [Pythium oligandrum]|eukprot:TMW55601.1 hypothetical protein Poli38472_010483 [Pythium oligandrum]